MHKDIKRVKNRLVLMQIFFLGIIAIGFAGFLVHLSIVDKQKAWKVELEQTTKYLESQLAAQIVFVEKKAQARSESLSTIEGDISEEEYLLLTRGVKEESDPSAITALEAYYTNLAKWVVERHGYHLFVIDQNGKLLLEPKKEGDALNLWQQHQSKIIYQMRKQGQGWLEYPHLTQRQWSEENNALRYVHIPHLDWTLAVEGRQVGYRSYLEQALRQQPYFYVIAIFLLGLVLFSFLTRIVFHQAEQMFAFIWQNKFVNLNTKTMKKEEKDWQQLKPQIQLPESVRLEEQAPIQVPRFEVPVLDPEKSQEGKVTKEAVQEHVQGQAEETVEEKEVVMQEPPKEVSMDVQVPRPADEVTNQEVAGVKLPLLRKILSEMKNV